MSSPSPSGRKCATRCEINNDNERDDDTSTTSSAASSPTRHHPKKVHRTSSAFDEEEDEELDIEEMYAELEEKYEVLQGKYGELQEENSALVLMNGGKHAAAIRGLKAKVESYAVLEKVYKKANNDKDAKLSAQEKSLKELKSSLKTAGTKQAAAVKECADRYKADIKELKAEHESKVKELKTEHTNVISELKKEQNERIREMKAEHRKDLAREEARGKNNVAEIEAKRKTDVKEMKDKGEANVKEKIDEIVALKKSIADANRAMAKEEVEFQKLERAAKYSEIRAKHSVDAHAKKQYINEVVRQKHQDDIREKRSSLVSGMGGAAGFCSMMERPNMLIMNGDVQSVASSSIHRGGGRKSWYSSASCSGNTMSGRNDDSHRIHRQHDERATSSHRRNHRDTSHHEKENRATSRRSKSCDVPCCVSLKSGYQGGEDGSDGSDESFGGL